VLDHWRIVDNSSGAGGRLIARFEGVEIDVFDEDVWQRLKGEADV
jgi:hypothetical protein